jgi:hypothetical protein
MTGEHIWDRWLRRYIPPKMKMYKGRHRLIDHGVDDVVVKNHKGDPAHRKAECVCEPCNNGWMSTITNEAKKVVIPLLTGEQHRLDSIKQRKLANWLALKVTTAEFIDRATVAISDEDRRYIYDHRMCPPHWRIWIGNLNRANWKADYIHETCILNIADMAVKQSNKFSDYNTQTTTFVCGKLFVQVLTSFDAVVSATWKFDRAVAPFIRPLWPETGYGLTWPPPTIHAPTADYISGAFLDYVAHLAGKHYNVDISRR